MALNYPQTLTRTLIGSKIADGTRTGVEMESTYQAESATEATKTFEVAGFSKMNLDFLYTMGASETSNTMEFTLEGSPDGINFYSLANETASSGTSTLFAREFTFTGTDGAAANISAALDIAYAFVRVSIKETGVAANKGAVYVEVTLSGK